MDINALGIVSFAAITVICYLIGEIVKLTPADNKCIPVVCGVFGGLFGLLWYFMGWPEFPAGDPGTAISVGIVSGLAATGINQVIKQFTTKEA